ncbi:hypothetical protein F5X96DRAFT_656425 [Biscogniauxia mediterranea]|nr:hypothetical protein F5X96DRAFT_656425 [Biscogniauxia mediterranea]
MLGVCCLMPVACSCRSSCCCYYVVAKYLLGKYFLPVAAAATTPSARRVSSRQAKIRANPSPGGDVSKRSN